MKTLKLLMITALVSFAMVSYANMNQLEVTPSSKLIINITFEEAIQIQGLAYAMHHQLNKKLLENNQKIYTLDVSYMSYIFRITGTSTQWNGFFKAVNTQTKPYTL
jgi:hypothetical protein